MTKWLVTAVLLMLGSFNGAATAQWKISAIGGYGFDDKMNFNTTDGRYFNAKIKSSALWGGGVEYVLKNNYGLELLYMREDTEVPVDYSYGSELGDSNTTRRIGINYILLAGNGYTSIADSPVQPFGSVLLGIALFSNKNAAEGSPSSSTKFAFGVRGGLDISATNELGFKVMAQLISATQAFEGEFYLGNGAAEYGLDPETNMLQFGISAGVTYRIGFGK
ncbi:MAG: hypothetical protein K1X85_03205 [Ignavibacteria bacterium]|nr:hypothetical protein [Ignavibacteria bacterium]